MNRFQGWIATLSDGTTVIEAPPIPGERTSWQKLITYLQEKGLKITGLQLQRNGIVVHPLSGKTVDGYYQAYEYRQKMFRDEDTLLQGVGSVIGDRVFITWINERGQIYQDLRDLAAERMHTTLRE